MSAACTIPPPLLNDPHSTSASQSGVWGRGTCHRHTVKAKIFLKFSTHWSLRGIKGAQVGLGGQVADSSSSSSFHSGSSSNSCSYSGSSFTILDLQGN